MDRQRINRISSKAMAALSFIALLCVASGYFGPPQADEGSAAHIFQLSILALAPTGLLFLVSANWKERWRSAKPLAIPAIALVLAFGGLYYLEHFR